jgi:hypothetical protein
MFWNSQMADTLNAQQFIDEAQQATGLSDFGSDDYEEPLNILINAINTESGINDIGFYRAKMTIEGGLQYRLRIQQYLACNPETLDQKVEKPVFIVSLPRTGTTALHHMLNADTANHTLRLWEAEEPLPPPEDATYLTDPRIEKRRQAVAMTEQFMPGFLSTHLLDAEAPDECHMLFNRCLSSAEYYSMFHIPSYAEWVYKQDLTKQYAYHKQQLQLLQSKKSGLWVLKSPFHQIGLKAILNTYPDAIIVSTHRAPMQFVASGCSFGQLLRNSCADSPDPHLIGQDWFRMLEHYTKTFESDRAELEAQYPGQFIDINHDDFVANPWAGIDAIYAARGEPLSAGGRAVMQQWVDDNPKGKHGKHSYQLEDYGLTKADVENLFGDYVSRHNLTME